MSISIRDLFSRQGIPNEIISLRNSLANHPDGIKMGVREAYQRLLTPADGNGFSRGCIPPHSFYIDYVIDSKDVGGALPNWVQVSGSTGLDHIPEDADFAGETRTVEGILVKSKISHTD